MTEAKVDDVDAKYATDRKALIDRYRLLLDDFEDNINELPIEIERIFDKHKPRFMNIARELIKINASHPLAKLYDSCGKIRYDTLENVVSENKHNNIIIYSMEKYRIVDDPGDVYFYIYNVAKYIEKFPVILYINTNMKYKCYYYMKNWTNDTIGAIKKYLYDKFNIENKDCKVSIKNDEICHISIKPIVGNRSQQESLMVSINQWLSKTNPKYVKLEMPEIISMRDSIHFTKVDPFVYMYKDTDVIFDTPFE